MSYTAVHASGGNHFDDLRLDIPASYREQDAWLARVSRASVRRSRLRNWSRLAVVGLERRTGLREPLVLAGVHRAWFDEFAGYWHEVLQGRPLTVADFQQLRFHYRTRAQHVAELGWGGRDEHLANWQEPRNLSATFEFVHRFARLPIRSRLLLRLLRRGWRVLEYGCGVAPMYRTWRTFGSHKPAEWVLADIANFPFHYARHVFGRDAEAELVAVEDFDDPLSGVATPFDLIIVQEVFEHLDSPRRIAEYLLDRLRPGGLLWFDYERSSGTGHNTPAGLAEREDTLRFLAGALDVIHGELRIDERSLGTCVGRKR